ncbi:MAG TPA: hypothetical protein VES02_05480 [Dermatophilaceae bacterium]|nr:hypothetical protein [Dermatophilaceae bacterium]
MASRRIRLVAGLVICAGLTGCAGKVIVAGEVSVLVSERATSGMDALGGGRLEVVGGCLGAGGTVIVWPHGTKVVNKDPLTIEIPDNGTFTLGEEVRVGGGYVLEHSSGESAADPVEVAGVTVPIPCSEHDVFLAR